MKSTKRFENAIHKLYNAFNQNTLHPECCKHCAVGNILDNKDSWKALSDNHGDTHLNYVGIINQKFGKKFNGYTPLELLTIEAAFLKGCGYSLPLQYNGIKPNDPKNTDVLFNGLNAAIQVLCTLDKIPNVMDYSKAFEKARVEQLYSQLPLE